MSRATFSDSDRKWSKSCTMCSKVFKTEKLIDMSKHFHKSSDRLDKLQKRCKRCASEQKYGPGKWRNEEELPICAQCGSGSWQVFKDFMLCLTCSERVDLQGHPIQNAWPY